MKLDMQERWGCKDGGIATLFDKATGKLDSIFNNANNFKFTANSETVYAQEKGANAIPWAQPKEGTLTFESQTTSFDQLSKSLGAAGLELSENKEEYRKYMELDITDDGVFPEAVLEYPAKSADRVQVFCMTRDFEPIKEIEMKFEVGDDLKTITYTGETGVLKKGRKIGIFYIAEVPEGKCYTFKVPATGSATSQELFIDVEGKSLTTNEPVLLQFHFFKVQAQEGVDITFSATDPSTFQVSLSVLADPSNKVKGANGRLEDGFFEVKAWDDYEDIEEGDVNDPSTISEDTSVVGNAVAGKAIVDK